jgi:hypothetical protein
MKYIFFIFEGRDLDITENRSRFVKFYDFSEAKKDINIFFAD